MTLLTAGYWPTTYWAENYWMQDYWPEYGTALPPAPPPFGGGVVRVRRKERFFQRHPELLYWLHEWLKLKVKED